jgi:lipoprotein signal peptidase
MKNPLVYLPCILVPIVDQMIKALSNTQIKNTGLILGYLSDFSAFTKSVLITSSFLIILAAFILVMILLNIELPALRFSASLFLGGVFSNCIDRMLLHYVRDLWTLDGEIFFNFADISQWIGAPLLIGLVFYHRQEIWKENCVRKSFIIVSKSHFKIIKNVLTIFLVTMTIYFLFNLSFLKFLNVGETAYKRYLVLSLIFGSANFILASVFVFIYAQRIVGPLQALHRHLVDDNLSLSNFQIRRGDPLVELKEITIIIHNMEKRL